MTDIESISLSAARRFARWDDGYFRHLARAAEDFADPRAATAWLTLFAEGIGLERLGPSRDGLLTHLLLRRLPQVLRLPPREQVRWLARAWNLAESLAAEPEWLEAYAHASIAAMSDIENLEAQLVERVAPVLAPAPPAQWTGPLAMAPVDPRPLDNDFLPGTFTPIAPRVVAVRDRLRDKALALVLGRDGTRIFPLGVAPDAPAQESGPAVDFTPTRLRVRALEAPVPTVKRAQAALATPAGAVLLAATDSQLIWVGTSP